MVTRNSKRIELPQIGELEESNKATQAVKGAALSERGKSKAGRKKKSDEEKASELLAVYVTVEQKKKLDENAKGVNISSLIKALLIEKGLI